MSQRGGRHQRLAAQGVGASEMRPQTSSLCEALLNMVGWGLMSSVTASLLARCAIQDGADRAQLRKLAQVGAQGTRIANSRRDLLRHFGGATNVPRPMAIDCPTIGKFGEVEITQQSVLSLPEVVQSLWENHRAFLMDERLGANPRAFWESISPDDPKLGALDPGSWGEGWEDRTWPCILHGDGGVYAKKNESSILIVSCKSLLAPTFDCNIIPGFILPKNARTEETADLLWRAYVHGINAAYHGVHSMVDMNREPWPETSPQAALAGQRLCDGQVRLVVWIVTGDLEFLANELRFPHFNSNDPCWLCPVSRRADAQFSITDYRVGAPWKQALAGDNEAEVEPITSEHPIEDLKGFTRYHVPGDLMHTGCGGVCAWTAGGVLYELVFDGPFVGSLAERVKSLWNEIQLCYSIRNTKNRLSTLKTTMFYKTHDTWARFNGKCADTRSLIYVLSDVCKAFSTNSPRGSPSLAVFGVVVRHRRRALRPRPSHPTRGC